MMKNKMSTINSLCFEYLDEFVGIKCCTESIYWVTPDIRDEWCQEIINEAFDISLTNGGFWKWLGGDEHVMNIQETIRIIKFVGMSDPQLSDYIYSNEMLMTMYAYIYMKENFADARICILNKMQELLRIEHIDLLDSKLTVKMSNDYVFHQWIIDTWFTMNVSSSRGVAEICVDENITISNIVFAFENNR
jgi:hypothetical protein